MLAQSNQAYNVRNSVPPGGGVCGGGDGGSNRNKALALCPARHEGGWEFSVVLARNAARRVFVCYHCSTVFYSLSLSVRFVCRVSPFTCLSLIPSERLRNVEL